jgi:DNA repair exonuclease SbcCD ATPase subunit
MVYSLNIAELKKMFLRLLREDEEFRLAVAGLIGFEELLKRFERHEEELKRVWEAIEKLRQDLHMFMKEQEKRWEENNKRWEENNRRWEENNKKWEMNWRLWEENSKRWEENWRRWEENSKRWEENWRRWEENNKRWEENNKRWEEAYKRFEAIERKLLEHDKRFEVIEKILLEHSMRLDNIEKRVSRVELELGALSEVTLTRYIWEDLREELRSRGENVIFRRRNLRINGYDIDLFVESDKNIYIVEVKIKPSKKHVNKLLKMAKIVEERFKKPAILILTGAMIGDDVERYAENKNVKIYRY